MLDFVCERSGEHKVMKKKLKHEAAGSSKCGCLFKLHGYVVKEKNNWKLTILNGVHNHEILPYLVGHLLAGRLMENDKEIVRDLTKSSVKPKNILTNLKGKRKKSMTNIKCNNPFFARIIYCVCLYVPNCLLVYLIWD